MDDEPSIAIRNCDPNGCVMMYVSKMIPDQNISSKFLAFGRVFSGCLKPGLSVRIMGPDYKIGSDNNLIIKNITRCVTMIGNQIVSMNEVNIKIFLLINTINKISMVIRFLVAI